MTVARQPFDEFRKIAQKGLSVENPFDILLFFVAR
jgi:hypothetical protein